MPNWHFQNPLINIHLYDGPGEFSNTSRIRRGERSTKYPCLFFFFFDPRQE